MPLNQINYPKRLKSYFDPEKFAVSTAEMNKSLLCIWLDMKGNLLKPFETVIVNQHSWCLSVKVIRICH